MSMISHFFAKEIEFEIFDMSGDDLEEAAGLHSERFRRPWSDDELHTLLVQETVYGFVARRANSARSLCGFVLARAAAGEAEILTIAVTQRHARRGLGWRLMRAAAREALNRDAEALFLEVDEGNAPATALYQRLGFTRVGERKAYYEGPGGAKSAALVMRLDLGRRP